MIVSCTHLTELRNDRYALWHEIQDVRMITLWKRADPTAQWGRCICVIFFVACDIIVSYSGTAVNCLWPVTVWVPDSLTVRDAIILLAKAIFINVQTFGIETKLRAGRTGVRIPAGTRDLSLLQNVYTCSGAHLACYSVGTGVIYWGKRGRCMKLTTHLDLAPKFIMSGDIPLLRLYVLMALTGTTLFYVYNQM
jgi:hypothetical protein